ncbi:MAG: glycosyltransferase family 4 protein [Dehalococcoidia bacterium]|nr:glycosyltransferase family 4 protein [Dehalococcoidia bacterium]
MKVLLVSGEFPPMIGGIGDYTACLARALSELGAQVTMLCSTRARSPEGAFPFPVLPLVAKWSYGSWGTVRRAVGSLRPDIVHIQYQSAAYGLHPAVNLLLLYLKLRVPGVRTFVTFHDLRAPYIFPKAGPLRGWAVRSLARWSHGVICTDESDFRTVSRWGLHSRSYLIPIGSNIQVVGPSGDVVRGESGDGPERGESVVLGYFGLLNQTKGVEILVRAFRLLLQRGLPLTMLMVGADLGDSDPTNVAYSRKVHALAVELGLDASIRWTGHLSPEDTSKALHSLDLCVLPYLDGASFRRGTLMAALAHGLPIITTSPEFSPEFGPRLIDGENCRLVPAGDVGALAQAMEELAGGPSLRQKLAAGALELARSFTWEEIARRTVAAYEGVLASRGRLAVQ